MIGKGSDKLGRWSWIDLRGRGSEVIRVVSAYRVSQSRVEDAGPLTACHQQYRALVKNNHPITSPKQAFLSDLEHEMLIWMKHEKHKVIIILDANETIAEKKGFASFKESVNLVDAIELLYSTPHWLTILHIYGVNVG